MQPTYLLGLMAMAESICELAVLSSLTAPSMQICRKRRGRNGSAGEGKVGAVSNEFLYGTPGGFVELVT